MINRSLQGINLYLFGSFLNSSKANDIDLLIEYDELLVSIDDALVIRKLLSWYLAEEFKLDIDICLLSKTENLQTQFIKNERGELLTLT